MPDATVLLDLRGAELARLHASAALGEKPLFELLDQQSWTALMAAARTAPANGVELFTRDGRVLDATIDPAEDGVAVALRDVTQYAEAAERFGGMAVELTRRNRDLRTLYEATARLGGTLDVSELGTATCRILAEYLEAAAVQLDLYDEVHQWPADATTPRPPDGVYALKTARGELGTVQWWRGAPLSPGEQEMVQLLISRAAIGLDHALLLSDAQDRAHRDPLTGLLNRAGAQRALASFGRHYAVALLDLDHFKQINDQHGHATGDRVLREVAELLRHGRSSDVRARWGGEEFLVALEGAELAEAVQWVERRLEQVREHVRIDGSPVTFSAGVARVTAEVGLDQALQSADEALYAAKHGGRDQVRSV